MIRPINDFVAVRCSPQKERTAGGLFIPESAHKGALLEGEILVVGGTVKDVNVYPGAIAIFRRGAEARVGDEDVVLLREENILGVRT